MTTWTFSSATAKGMVASGSIVAYILVLALSFHSVFEGIALCT